MDSNDLAVGLTTERMEPVPAAAPTQGQATAGNQQSPSRRRTTGESTPASSSGTDSTEISEAEEATHRVDNLA